MLAFLHASTAFLALFFYPIHHIGFVHLQYFPYASSADSSVVHFDRQLPSLFRVFVPFRVYGVIDAALLTFAALAPRSVIPRLDLVLYLSAFWASFPCLFCALSHIFYYTIKSLFWTLPARRVPFPQASALPPRLPGKIPGRNAYFSHLWDIIARKLCYRQGELSIFGIWGAWR